VSADTEFLARQQRRLTSLRTRLLAAVERAESEERELNASSAEAAGEREDDAQRMAALELEGNVVVRDTERLARVDRALEKIKDGTYEVSDVSGQPIPRERLEAVPEATCNVDEAVSLPQTARGRNG
jgi:DnaK suppressor protein